MHQLCIYVNKKFGLKITSRLSCVNDAYETCTAFSGMLRDALNEMILAYKELGKEVPFPVRFSVLFGTSHPFER